MSRWLRTSNEALFPNSPALVVTDPRYGLELDLAINAALRALGGFAAAPQVLMPDGSVLSKEGYDAVRAAARAAQKREPVCVPGVDVRTVTRHRSLALRAIRPKAVAGAPIPDAVVELRGGTTPENVRPWLRCTLPALSAATAGVFIDVVAVAVPAILCWEIALGVRQDDPDPRLSWCLDAIVEDDCCTGIPWWVPGTETTVVKTNIPFPFLV